MEYIGIAAACLELLGIYLCGNRSIWCWPVFGAGNVLWLTYVLATGNAIGLLIVCSVALVLNVRGYRAWESS